MPSIPTPLLAYLRLRARVVSRQLRELGWWRLVLLGALLLAFAGGALRQAAQHPRGQWAVPLVLLGLVWSAHRRRPDLVFLRAAGPDFRLGLAAEYALLALPVAGALLALGAGVGAGLLTLILPSLAALAGPARERTPRLRRPRSLFRSEAFEWVSGMRGVGGGLWWLALLAGALWQHATPLGPVLALAGWLLVVLSCYGTPEPATMLLLAARRPESFLRRRLVLALGYAALTAAPFGWLLATSPAGPGAAGGAAGLLLVLTGLLILIKYAFYPNGFLIRFSQGIVIGFVLSQPGNPVYPPLLAALLGGLLWQSRRRLGQFRYDEGGRE
ncbi:hypothetical protein [uncultured Hymenobacter sp.]|uniref:hypothetical protein n=1 Tax=uncultured Hymenobacter sp. TaxID=170016 RepID=UPI0035CBDBB9